MTVLVTVPSEGERDQALERHRTHRTDRTAARGPVRDATRHPTRGFVAYDPEGYFLEFERFLDHPQNAALLKALAR